MTNNVKTSKQTKKNPLDVEAGKYRLWEKLRRDRFNAGLESLSASLPDYEPGVSKWTKADIVERALNYIKALQAQRIPDDLQRRIKGLKRQNSKLREIVRSKLAREMEPKEFSKLNLQEIQSLINKYEEAKANKENTPQKPVGEDHSYSLCSQGTPEPDLEVTSEEVVEDPSPETPTVSSSVPVSSSSSTTSLVTTGTTLTLKPITILSTAPTGALLNPTTWTVPQHSLIAIDPNQIVSSVPVMMRPLIKLPLPRLSRVPKTSSKSPTKKSVVEETKKRKESEKSPEDLDKASDTTSSTKGDSNAETSDSSPPLNLPSTNLDEFVLKASSTLPDAILASEDPLTQEIEETENVPERKGEKETSKENTSKNEEAKDKTCESSPTASKDPKASKKVETRKSQGDKACSTGKKSKSSYSIAALCQISVNIGGDALVPSETMVNSPGVVSLNSVGTASPSVTPAPSTPPAPTPPIEKKEADKVIQELKPVPPLVIKQATEAKGVAGPPAPAPIVAPNPAPPIIEKNKPFINQSGTTVSKKDNSVTKHKKNENSAEINHEQSKTLSSSSTKDSNSTKSLGYSSNTKCDEKTNNYKKDSSVVSHQSKAAKQWTQQPQIHSTPQYQHMPPSVLPSSSSSVSQSGVIPKDTSKLPSKDTGKGMIQHYANKVPNQVAQLHQIQSRQQQAAHSQPQPQQQSQQQVHTQQQYQGYSQGSIQNPLFQQQHQTHVQQHQDFHYGSTNNSSTILNEFLGHPLQTPVSLPSSSSSTLGTATVPQFHHQGNESHRYNYSLPSAALNSSSYHNTTHHHHQTSSSSSSIDYHQQHHSGNASSITNTTNQVIGSHGGLQNDQYFPYNRSYYVPTQNPYELTTSSTKLPQHKVSQQILQQHVQQQQQLQQASSQQMANNNNNSMMQQPNTFSVNQLVSSSSNSKSQQRKVTKRSAAATAATGSAPATASPATPYELPAKKPNRNPGTSSNEKDASSSRGKEDKKSKGGSLSRSSNKSSSSSSSLLRKGNYSAESLIMDPSQYAQNIPSLEFQQHLQQHGHQGINSSKSKMDFSSGWTPSHTSSSSSSTTTMNITPSVESSALPPGSQFCSMSPSPFPQDLEFSMFISGNDNSTPSSSYGSSSHPLTATTTKNNYKTGNNKMSGNGQNQSALFDNSNLFPLPTMTPPAVVEDPYAGFMNHSHTQSGSSYHQLSSSQKQGYNNSNTSNTSNKHLFSSTGGTSGRFGNSSNTGDYPALNTANSNNSNNNPSNNSVPSSSSLVNFNLSTIFPEINEKFGGNGLVPPSTTTSASTSTSSTQTISSTTKTASNTDFRQVSGSISTSELLPHSIAMLGHSGQQACVTSMAFNGSSSGVSLSGLHFQQQPQQ